MADIAPLSTTHATTGMPWLALVGSAARWGLTFVGSWLLDKGITSPESTESLISAGAGIAMGLAALAWSLLQKHLAQQGLRRALMTRPDAPQVVADAVTRLAP